MALRRGTTYAVLLNVRSGLRSCLLGGGFKGVSNIEPSHLNAAGAILRIRFSLTDSKNGELTMEEIKVHVVAYGDRTNLIMRYADPMTGKYVCKSSGQRTRKEAERAAAKWEAELREGRYCPGSKMAWADFRTRYEDEVLGSLAAATDRKVSGVFNSIESILSPKRLRDLTAQRLSYFQSKLREAGRSENTIKSCLAHLQAALNWAVSQRILSAAPTIQFPKRAKGGKMMKGRPITGEEFDRMIAAAAKVVGADRAPSWTHYLRGLWLSGLRLAESLELCWDRDDKLCVDLSGKRPMLRIPAALEKGNKDRLLPMAPEFAEFLLAIPEADRTGYVFHPAADRRHGERLGRFAVCNTVCAIGKRAGVKVETKTKGDKETVKYASAHDLRRSFGERWSSRVMPQVLMELMRHESIETTLRFYVGKNAQATADVLWEAHGKAIGNTFGNTPQAATVENQ
jgi:integrase